MTPHYCLVGDTVNISARMESNSEVNRIHCSKAAAKILYKQCPQMSLVSRGEIPIKGKGNMHTYWVNESADIEAATAPPEFAASMAVRSAKPVAVIHEHESLELSVEDALPPPPECSPDENLEGRLKERLSRGMVEV